MTYTYCKKVIESTTYRSQEQKNDMQQKLDVFLLNDRIDQPQYTELTAMLTTKDIAGSF
jgi:hypothetical protein